MTPTSRKNVAQAGRIGVVAVLGVFLWRFRAFSFLFFYLGLVLFLTFGWLAVRRRGHAGPLVGAVQLYFALFLLPPGLIGLAGAPMWTFVGVAVLAGLGVAAWRQAWPWRATILALVTAIALLSALAFMDTFKMHPGRAPANLTGNPAAVDDGGWDGARLSLQLATFAPLHKYGEQVVPVPGGDPPVATVLGLLEKPGGRFVLRPFTNETSVELNPPDFTLPGCPPVRDVDFDRERHQWLVLCDDGTLRALSAWAHDTWRHQGWLGQRSQRMAVNQDLDRLYILDPAWGHLVEYDLETRQVLRKVFVGFGAADVLVAPNGESVYLAMPYLGRVSVLDTASLEKRKSIPAPLGVAHLAVNRAQQLVYAVSLPGGRLVAIDATTNRVVARARLRATVFDLKYNDATDRLYWLTPYGPRWAWAGELLK